MQDGYLLRKDCQIKTALACAMMPTTGRSEFLLIMNITAAGMTKVGMIITQMLLAVR